MGLVTVQGAGSINNVTVTVSGCDVDRLTSLMNQFTSDVLATDPASIREKTMSSDHHSFSTANAVGYGAVTTNGAYQLAGNVGFLAVGTLDPNKSSLNYEAFIDARDVTSHIDVAAGTQHGITYMGGTAGGNIVAADGTNLINVAGGNWKIDTGCGNDTIMSATGSDTVNAGKGDNFVYLGGDNNVITSEGQDTVTALGTSNNITIYGGSSQITAGKSSYVIDTAGNDNITVDDSSFVFGGHNDVITTHGSATVTSGMSDTISACGDLQEFGFNSDVETTVTGRLEFIGGSRTGNQTVTAGQSTIFGGSGMDMKIFGTTNQGDTTLGGQQSFESQLFVAGQGNETIDASGSVFGLHAFGTNIGDTGTQVMIGGTSTDTLVVGVGNATLTGGTGDANFFALRDGIAGYDYTITDFASAAGNIVALYHYKESDITNAVANQTHSGGNTTVTLSDNSQITFLGVNDVKGSDFVIW